MQQASETQQEIINCVAKINTNRTNRHLGTKAHNVTVCFHSLLQSSKVQSSKLYTARTSLENGMDELKAAVQTRRKQMPISGPLIQDKVSHLAGNELVIEDFKSLANDQREE